MSRHNPPPVRSKKTTGQCLDTVIDDLNTLTRHMTVCAGCTRGNGLAASGVGCRTGNELAHKLTLDWLALKSRLPQLAGTQTALDFTNAG